MRPEYVTLCEEHLKDAIAHKVDYSVLLSSYVAELLLEIVIDVKRYNRRIYPHKYKVDRRIKHV